MLPLHVKCGVSVLTSQKRTVVSPEPLARYLKAQPVLNYWTIQHDNGLTICPWKSLMDTVSNHQNSLAVDPEREHSAISVCENPIL